MYRFIDFRYTTCEVIHALPQNWRFDNKDNFVLSFIIDVMYFTMVDFLVETASIPICLIYGVFLSTCITQWGPFRL